eukprot:5161943-Pleurochrysis_carterae.AAC.2
MPPLMTLLTPLPPLLSPSKPPALRLLPLRPLSATVLRAGWQLNHSRSASVSAEAKRDDDEASLAE